MTIYRHFIIFYLVLFAFAAPGYGQWNSTVADGVNVFTPEALPDPGTLAPGSGLPSARVEIPGTANVTDTMAGGGCHRDDLWGT